MSGAQKVISAYPEMDGMWTGASGIHKSKAVEFVLDPDAVKFLSAASHEVIIRVLARAEFHNIVSKHLETWPLGPVEWLIEKDAFNKLVYFLLFTNLQGSQPDLKGKKIKNPSTGNIFIPLFIKDDTISGIRFWCGASEYGGGSFSLGFRVRFEGINNKEHEEDERQRVKDVMEQVAQTTNEVAALKALSDYEEISEPITDEEKGLRVRIRTSQEAYSDAPDFPEPSEDTGPDSEFGDSGFGEDDD